MLDGLFIIQFMIKYYFVIISIISAILFAYDKHAAKKHKWRIPEKVLHTTELLGGVFVIIPLMYLIHHKSRKSSYYLITYFVLILWLGAIYLFSRYALFCQHA